MEEKNYEHREDKLSRREFLKLAGVAAAALSTGYTAGRWRFPQVQRKMALNAFIPEDEALAGELAKAFWQFTGGPGNLLVEAEERWMQALRAAAGPLSASAGSLTSVRIARLAQPVPADLLLSDNRRGVYDPASQFSAAMTAARQRLQGLAAGYTFSATFSDQAGGSAGRPWVLIHAQHGPFDRLPLESKYTNIPVEGPFGITHLRLEDGRLWVHSASCRHNLCQQAGQIGRPGERVACAPNRVLVEIEMG